MLTLPGLELGDLVALDDVALGAQAGYQARRAAGRRGDGQDVQVLGADGRDGLIATEISSRAGDPHLHVHHTVPNVVTKRVGLDNAIESQASVCQCPRGLTSTRPLASSWVHNAESGHPSPHIARPQWIHPLGSIIKAVRGPSRRAPVRRPPAAGGLLTRFDVHIRNAEGPDSRTSAMVLGWLIRATRRHRASLFRANRPISHS
jgi:hypothetical protein